MNSVWADLAMFESHDVIRQKYKQLHGGEISAAKASEIAAFFSQGRQYFEAAEAAGSLVSPLLKYYGVNGLTRGAILYLDRNKRQASLKPSHGVSALNWQKTLAGGLAKIADLELQFDISGSFAEFTKATGNRTSVPVLTEGFKRKFVDVPGTVEITSRAVLTLKDVLSRMPDMLDIYEEVTGEEPNVRSIGIIQSADEGHTHIDIFGSITFPPDEKRLKLTVPQLNTWAVTPQKPDNSRPALRFSLSHQGSAPPPDALPPLRYADGLTLLVLPFDGGLEFSPTAVYYLFSYACGMLGRYFPQHWQAFLAGGRGDRLHPLIVESLRQLPYTFPKSLSSELATA